MSKQEEVMWMHVSPGVEPSLPHILTGYAQPLYDSKEACEERIKYGQEHWGWPQDIQAIALRFTMEQEK